MKHITVKLHNSPVHILKQEAGLQELSFLISQSDPVLEFSFPFVDCMGIWTPLSGCNRSHNADWAEPVVSMTSKSAPVVSVFSEDSQNRCTLALSETREMIYLYAGIHEEDGMFHIKAVFPFSPGHPGGREVKVRLDTRNISFSSALGDVTAWWEQCCGLIPMEAPDIAKRPMYSSWYSYHQMIDGKTLETECALAKKMGFHSIIVDDGWQTDDASRGYAYCGDWNVCPAKISDMAAHVSRVHELGMKYLLWFSVPFVGKKSCNWDRFQDKILYYDEELQAGVLDPRYPDVREFLVGTYRSAVVNYQLDGLKLDFIDQFVEKQETPAPNHAMDFPSLQDAVDCLMMTVSQTLKQVNPHIMLEFRQFYTGPNIRRYGNIFRVDDCPGSALRNRVGIVDLRLLCGHSAVHSDMLMWHPNEEPEEIAIQLISCLFGTVQVSVLVECLKARQQAVVSFWTRFMDVNRHLLLESSIEVLEPHNLYPEVWVENEKERLTAVYSGNRVLDYSPGKKWTVANGTKCSSIYLKVSQPVSLQLEIRDCTGLLLQSDKVSWQPKIAEIAVPAGGILTLV